MNAARDILMAFVAAFDQHDPDGIGELYAPDAASRWPDAIEDIDVAAVRARYRRWFTAMPDAQVRYGVADGRRAVAEMTIIGTNSGPLQLTDVDRAVLGTHAETLPPTGRSVVLPVAFAINIADGYSRAWYLAAAAIGPDEAVATALVAAAGEARQRNGLRASARTLHMAAELTA